MAKLTRKPDLAWLLRALVLLACDFAAMNLAQFLALFVRFEFDWRELVLSGFLESVVSYAPYYFVCTLLIFGLFRLYQSLWMYAGAPEVLLVLGASAVSAAVQYAGVRLLGLGLPRSFPVMNFFFLALFTLTERFAYRFFRHFYHAYTGEQSRTMLIGAGEAGDIVMQDLKGRGRSRNRIICVVDDDKSKQGYFFNGVRVVGGQECIESCVASMNIQEIILAIPSVEASRRRSILEHCQRSGCQNIKIMPGIRQLADGEVAVQKLRPLEVEDLLGRDPVRVNLDEIAMLVEGKTVLVTGGGGSIGSELCRQVAARNPGELIILDIYENNAYVIQQELRRTYPELALTVLIGSVRDEERLERIFCDFRPEVVFHAAAHKHVPLMEESPCEAVKNNVFGTLNVAEAADRYGTGIFVLISTDKAVNPTNIMGASKRICEMIIQDYSRHSTTKFVAVRFGNVLGSNGSVVPLFRRQIEAGGPVTVTHPEVERYFMTIPEAVSLVMQAGAYARGGEIFVLDMGKPVRIDDLARNMIRLSGYEPDKDIQIVYTGLRPGEKLYEELLLSEEGLGKTSNNLIFIGHPLEISSVKLKEGLERLRSAAERNDPDIGREIARLVDTYRPEQAAAAAY